ncbi:hypothetical protein M422DRAFT_259106 [Sphaerobolus stellatus SS14]|uniref:Uncharacterized protein n=1 Tax=Sphaerobolus stellatus (strain SS14) TaxID=990650 RepID=A0A0C9V9H6_SPHS4|nr:hypothetical protein M422DRAFT_259106 [Sphaerobolus stellatus SS14]
MESDQFTRKVAAMVPFRRLGPFVKGYEFNDEKIGSAFEFDGLALPRKVDSIVNLILRTVLDDEGYEALAVGNRVDHDDGRSVFILVLDDDDDLEKLKERPLPKPLHWSIERIMLVLDGPHVYKPII